MNPETNDDAEPGEAERRLRERLVAAGLGAAAVLQESAGPLATLACLAAVEALAPVPAATLEPGGVALVPAGRGVPVTRPVAAVVALRLVGRLYALNAGRAT